LISGIILCAAARNSAAFWIPVTWIAENYKTFRKPLLRSFYRCPLQFTSGQNGSAATVHAAPPPLELPQI
jgi:hypothetical protein